MWKSGDTCFFVANLMASSLYGDVSKTPPSVKRSLGISHNQSHRDGNLHPKMIATMNSDPARFPQKVMNQCNSIFVTDSRLCNTETVVYINVPVQRSAPVKTIITKPYGKTIAPSIRIKPGALTWYHGLVLVLREVAAAKERSAPADIDERKTFDIGMFPLWTPARETISITCDGVYAL